MDSTELNKSDEKYKLGKQVDSKSFAEMINELIHGGNPSEVDVQRFSDLDLQNVESLKLTWQKIPTETRKTIVFQAIQLSDESIDYEYSRFARIVFDDIDPIIRRASIELVQETEDRLTARCLRGLLADPEEEVAAAAAEALGRYVLLTEMSLFDKEEGSKIVEDLREITSQDKAVELRAGAIESLASIDLDWVQPLIIDAYYDSDDRMRLSAVRAMGRTASSSWLEYIYEQLEVEDPFFRLEAVLAIAEIADESSIDSLSILFEDEDAEDQYKWSLLKPALYHYDERDQDRLIYKNTFEKQDRIIKGLSMLQVTFRTKKYKNWLQEVLSWFDKDIHISKEKFQNKLDTLILNTFNSNELYRPIFDDVPLALGTATPHFLFNFIDYLMWVKGMGKHNFEFKYRNSVEHHLSQSARNENNEKYIHHLGNLCLVSKGGNSKMNNESPVGKAKVGHKYYREDLPPKQKRMYDLTNSNSDWGPKEILEHYDELKDLLSERKEILGL